MSKKDLELKELLRKNNQLLLKDYGIVSGPIDELKEPGYGYAYGAKVPDGDGSSVYGLFEVIVAGEFIIQRKTSYLYSNDGMMAIRTFHPTFTNGKWSEWRRV